MWSEFVDIEVHTQLHSATRVIDFVGNERLSRVYFVKKFCNSKLKILSCMISIITIIILSFVSVVFFSVHPPTESRDAWRLGKVHGNGTVC